MDDNKIQDSTNNSLETPDTEVSSGVVKAPEANVNSGPTVQSGSGAIRAENPIKHFLSKINIYFILLITILILLGIGAVVAYRKNSQAAKEASLKPGVLSQAALDKLAGTDSTIGDAKQTLTVESNAIFNGGIVIRGSIDVVGDIKTGAGLTLPQLNVGGTANIDQAALKGLTVTGDSTLQGKLTLQGNLSVSGAAAFKGAVSAPQITVDTLQLNKDIQLSHHIVTNGSTPSRSQGSGLGGGGTATVSGSDTSGTIVINTGNSAPSGCFITITFVNSFGGIPKVIISPSSSSAASIDYYTNRSAGSFSVCSASDPPDNTSGITFDYIVIG